MSSGPTKVVLAPPAQCISLLDPLLLIPEFCPGGQRQRLTLNNSILFVENDSKKASKPIQARIRCQDLASSRTHCLLPLDAMFLARSKLPMRDLEIFYCLLARSADKKRS